MPKKLSTKEAIDRLALYGYIVPENFTYINSKTKFNVYDERLNKNVMLSMNMLSQRQALLNNSA